MSHRIHRLLASLLIAALTSACDQGPGSSVGRHGTEPPATDEVGRLIQQVKDDLAGDRIGEALALMERLLDIRNSQPPTRQVEIDRLDAMFAAERLPAERR